MFPSVCAYFQWRETEEAHVPRVRVRFLVFLEDLNARDLDSVTFIDELFDTPDFELLKCGYWLTCRNAPDMQNHWRLKHVTQDRTVDFDFVHVQEFEATDFMVDNSLMLTTGRLRFVARLTTVRYQSTTSDVTFDFSCGTVPGLKPVTFIAATQCVDVLHREVSDVGDEAAMQAITVVEGNMKAALRLLNPTAFKAAFPNDPVEHESVTVFKEDSNKYREFDAWARVTETRRTWMKEYMHYEYSEDSDDDVK